MENTTASPAPEPTLPEYYDLLDNFNWYGEFSDDHRIFKACTKYLDELRGYRRISPAHNSLYERFTEWRYLQHTKPERPAEAESEA